MFTGNEKLHEEGFRGLVMPVVFLMLFLALFLALWRTSPLGIYPDSGSYMSMQAGREPVYPLFLSFFRKIYHEKDTLVWMASSGTLDSEKGQELLRKWPALHTSTLVQSILAAISCSYFSACVCRAMKKSGIWAILIYICSLLPYILTPLASSSHMVIGRAVLTEGIAFPLFGFFAGSLVLMALTGKGGVRAFLFLLILVLTRNQMLLYLPVFMIILGARLYTRGRERRPAAFIIPVITAVAFITLVNAGNRIYTAAVNPGYKGASTGPYNILTTCLYLSGDDTADLIEDEEAAGIFKDMYYEAADRGLTLASSPGGILKGAYHYEDAYDTIGFEIQQPVMFNAAADKGIPDDEALNEVIRNASIMVDSVFPGLMIPYVINYLRSFASGLTRSVAASGTIMGICAVFLYSIAIVSMVYLWRRERYRKEAVLTAVSLFMILANAGATALMIMCLSRYMIYNTPLFYMTLLCCISTIPDIYKEYKCHTKD